MYNFLIFFYLAIDFFRLYLKLDKNRSSDQPPHVLLPAHLLNCFFRVGLRKSIAFVFICCD